MKKLVRKTIKVKNMSCILFTVPVVKEVVTVRIEEDEKNINAKSIMGTISLAIKEGDTISIVATGTDEEKAVEEICKILS